MHKFHLSPVAIKHLEHLIKYPQTDLFRLLPEVTLMGSSSKREQYYIVILTSNLGRDTKTPLFEAYYNLC